jgi:hypothetical protein
MVQTVLAILQVYILKNVHWANKDKPFVIAGVPNHFVEDVTFDNCYLAGKPITGFKDADFQMEFSKDIKFIAPETQRKSSKK